MKKSDLVNLIEECITEVWSNKGFPDLTPEEEDKLYRSNEKRLGYNYTDEEWKNHRKLQQLVNQLRDKYSSSKYSTDDLYKIAKKQLGLKEHWSEELGASPMSVVEETNDSYMNLNTVLDKITTKVNHIIGEAENTDRNDIKNKLKEIYVELNGIDRDLGEYITTTLNINWPKDI